MKSFKNHVFDEGTAEKKYVKLSFDDLKNFAEKMNSKDLAKMFMFVILQHVPEKSFPKLIKDLKTKFKVK